MSQPIRPATISSTEVQTHFGAVIRRVVRKGEHIIVERGGLPVLVIVPINDYPFDFSKKGGEPHVSRRHE